MAISIEELQLAARNKGMPLEGLRWDITPTGMHYQLIHFDVPALGDDHAIELAGFARPGALTIAALRARPAVTMPVTMECAGNGRARLDPRPISQPWLQEAVGTATWTGASLADLIDELGVPDDAVELVFTGADHGVEKGHEHDYARALTIAEARRAGVMLAYEMNGRPLEPQHGAPVRLLVPGWYGMTSVKWLRRIEAVTAPFDGYQQRVAYWYKQRLDEQGEPVTRIRPRALMAPPGFPDFLTRKRTVERGPVTVIGRAWSGHGAIVRVEVGVDGAWADANVHAAAGPYAWRKWTFVWDAAPGEHVLSCRATDATGLTQPLEQPWNVQGMGNNQVQHVPVTVR